MNMIKPCRVNWNGFRATDLTATELHTLSQNTTAPSVIEQDGRLYDVVCSDDIVTVKRNEANKGYVPAFWAVYDFFERGFSTSTRAAAFETRLNQLKREQAKMDRSENLAALIHMTLDQKSNVSIGFPNEFIRLEGNSEEKQALQQFFIQTLNVVAENHSKAILLLREKTNEKLRALYDPLSLSNPDVEQVTESLKILQSQLKLINSINQNHKQIYLDYAHKMVSAKSPALVSALLNRMLALSDELNTCVSSLSFDGDDHERAMEAYRTGLIEHKKALDEINVVAINSLLTPPALKGEGIKGRQDRAEIYKQSTGNFIDVLRDCKSSACQIKEGVAALTVNKRQLKHQLALGAEITNFLDAVPPHNTSCLKHLGALSAWRDTCINPRIFLRADNIRKIQAQVENCVASNNMSLALSRCITSCLANASKGQFNWRLDALKKLELFCQDPFNILSPVDIAEAGRHMSAIILGDEISEFLSRIDNPNLFHRSSFDLETQARINTLAVLKVACYSGTVGKTENNKKLHAVLTEFEGIDFIKSLAVGHMREINKSLSNRGWFCQYSLMELTYEDLRERERDAKVATIKKETKQLKRVTMEALEREFERKVVLEKLAENTSQLLVSSIQFKEAAMKFRLGQTAIGRAVLWFNSAFK